MKTFNDIQFTDKKGWNQWTGNLQIGDFTLSVVAGERLYSLPRTFQDSIDDYAKFEVAVLDKNREFVTELFVNDMEDEVLGWQTRDEINQLITIIENFNK